MTVCLQFRCNIIVYKSTARLSHEVTHWRHDALATTMHSYGHSMCDCHKMNPDRRSKKKIKKNKKEERSFHKLSIVLVRVYYDAILTILKNNHNI